MTFARISDIVVSTSGQTTSETEMTGIKLANTTPLLTSTIPAVTGGNDVKVMARWPSLFRNLVGKARSVLETDTSAQESVKSGEDGNSEDAIFGSFKLPMFSVGSDDATHKTRKINLIKTVDAADELQSRKAQEGDTTEVDNLEEKIKSITGATKPIPRLNLFRRFDSFKDEGVHNNE